MKKTKFFLFVLLTAPFLLIGCADMDGALAGNNRFTFEGTTRSIERTVASQTGDNYTFEFYSDANGKPNDYFIVLTFPANLNDTLFTIPTASGNWNVRGAVKGIAFNGDRSGRDGFQSMDVRIKTIDGAGTRELMFSLALEDNRCMKGYYKGRIN